MEYSFNLDWDELSDDLREQKIDEVIEYDFGNSNLLDDDGEPRFADLESALEDIDLRRDVEDTCRAYFPMYF